MNLKVNQSQQSFSIMWSCYYYSKCLKQERAEYDFITQIYLKLVFNLMSIQNLLHAT